MAEATVRTTTSADAVVVAELQRQVWQQAYAAFLPASVLLGSPEEWVRRWTDRIGAGGPVLLAAEGREPVGFAAVAGAPDDDGVGEVEVLYVLPRWGRRGHGGRLIAAAAQHLRLVGAVRGRWWIPDADTASASFAHRAGWSAGGEVRRLDTGEGVLTEVSWAGSLDLRLG